jgi:hypothetical protein
MSDRTIPLSARIPAALTLLVFTQKIIKLKPLVRNLRLVVRDF